MMKKSFAVAFLLAALVPATAFLHDDIVVEYMWCCQDAWCLEACQALCDGTDGPDGHAAKPEFCVNGTQHPQYLADNGDGKDNGSTKSPLDLGLEGGDNRRLQFNFNAVQSGCGDRPEDQESDAHSEWVDCFFAFFEGNTYSKRHCQKVLPITCCEGGVCGGEPHFKTWNDVWYDYHGECDLNFIHAPSFAASLGLDIHIRTQRRNQYSFIEAAAIKIGNDILEIGGFGVYILNGVEGADLETAELGAFKVSHNAESKKVHRFKVEAGDHSISVKTSKDFVSVTLDDMNVADYIDSEGMLGQFGTGILYGRDGRTVYSLDNINDFGQEWQVRPEEPRLFENTKRAPQYPQRCLLPTPGAAYKRRLGEQAVSKEDAETACAGWRHGHKDQCVFDVMSTGDIELAAAGGY